MQSAEKLQQSNVQVETAHIAQTAERMRVVMRVSRNGGKDDDEDTTQLCRHHCEYRAFANTSARIVCDERVPYPQHARYAFCVCAK